MKLSTSLLKLEEGQPLKNGTAKDILNLYCSDCLVKVIVDGQVREIKEIRQLSTGTNEPIIHAFVV